jgi:Ca2+-binding EF-hand superfamily protein
LKDDFMKNLAEALPEEQQRVRELLPIYDAIPTGVFAATMMRESLSRAEQAAASGDVVAMLAAYEDLKGYKA